jgi:cytoskeletal protein CcmA (bactofilin family)
MLRKILKIAAAVQIALLITLLSVTPTAAAELHGYDDVIIASGDVVNDDLYLAGNRITINGVVYGDVIAAGSTVNIGGRINGDVIVLASTLNIDGEITGSLRTAASTINIGGVIGQDLVVAGSTIELGNTAEIGRDLVFGASSMKVKSTIARNVLGIGENVEFSDLTGGSVSVEVESLTIDSTATIKGDLIYTSDNEVKIRQGAVIGGRITQKIPDHDQWYRNWTFTPAMKAWARAIAYLMVLLLGIIIILIAPRKSAEVVSKIQTTPLKSLGWGALVFFVTPIAIVIAILTIIGIPIGLIAALLYGVLIFISQLVVGLFIGRLILTRFNVEETKGSLIGGLFIGFTLLTLVKLIPVVGFILWWPIVLFGIGAIVLMFGRKKKQETAVEVIEEAQS